MFRKKRILFVITYLQLGGAQKQLLYILKNLDKSRYEIHLYAGNKGYLKPDFLKIPGINIQLDPCLVREINPLFDIAVFFKLLFFIRKHKFDIVHTHSPKASILARWAAYAAGVKNIIYTVHGWPFHKFMNPLMYYFYLFLEKITALITKKIIVVSKPDLEKGLKYNIAQADKFSLIHYGIDISKFDDIWTKKHNQKFSARRAGKEAGKYTVLTVSSLKPQKGIMIFLDAAQMLLKEFPDLEFVIAGDGPLRNKISREITKCGLEKKVFLSGWVSDISKLLEKAGLFVLTSLWEGLPVALIESIAAGLPFAVTNTGGVLDIAESYHGGIVINSFEAQAVKNSCSNILKNYKKWSRIIVGERGRFNAGYWSYERMIDEIENIYESI